MKNLIIPVAMLLSVHLVAQNSPDSLKTIDLKEVVVSSTRATDKTPMTFNEVSKEEIEENNLGKDLPYLLELTPSAVTTSDAGAGVGYTGIRIRGSDAARVNVTLNGIPYNDPESMGVFWVNLPDFASSVSSIQVQRGLGTSTNGAGAFGASINIETDGLNKEAYATLDNGYGSFNTRKHTVLVGTGLINDKFAFDARLSQITSDGYIDRASVDLNSYFLSGGYYGKKSLIKFNIFSGHEITYQSWYGTPEARVNNDEAGIDAYIARNWLSEEAGNRLKNDGRTYNEYTYENEVDNYEQTHYQMISSFDLTNSLTLNFSLFLIHGEGYFEQYKEDRDFDEYGLAEITMGDEVINTTDLIQRRWLNNNFYGSVYSLDYNPNDRVSVTFGGGINRYDGDHYGRIIWARNASDSEIRAPYYNNNSIKDDFNWYTKITGNITDNLIAYMDLQSRYVNYTMRGIDNDQQIFDIENDYAFFNPKFGLKMQLDDQSNVYASMAIGSKEPIRSDFIDNLGDVPKAEKLRDLEIGYARTTNSYSFAVNAYNMAYEDQLIPTGALNDVGSSLRTNVDKSYRRGVELQLSYQHSPLFAIGGNATISKNKITRFTEVIYNSGVDWDEYVAEEINHKDSDIAYSPNVVAGVNLTIAPIEGWKFRLIQKYVGEQYLDNTSSSQRKLDAYAVTDLISSYEFSFLGIKSIKANIGVYNLLNSLYSSNGYTWGYRGGGEEIREVFLYPQAGINIMTGLTIKF